MDKIDFCPEKKEKRIGIMRIVVAKSDLDLIKPTSSQHAASQSTAL
jgi:hypothetical protein